MGFFRHSRHYLQTSAWFAIAALALAAGPAERAQAQGAVRSVHKDWQIRCDTPPGAKTEQCVLIQSVAAEDRANVGLTVIVLKTADAEEPADARGGAARRALAVGARPEDRQNDVGRAGFVRCLPNGCIAEVVMDDELIKQDAHRQDRDLHHLPDAGRRHRLSHEPRRFRRGLRQAALTVCPPSPLSPNREYNARRRLFAACDTVKMPEVSSCS